MVQQHKLEHYLLTSLNSGVCVPKILGMPKRSENVEDLEMRKKFPDNFQFLKFFREFFYSCPSRKYFFPAHCLEIEIENYIVTSPLHIYISSHVLFSVPLLKTKLNVFMYE